MRNWGWLAVALSLLGGCERAAPPPPAAALDTLEEAIQRLTHPDPVIRHAAMYQVAQAGARAAHAIPDLIGALRHGDPSDRYWAANALRHMGVVARCAADALVRAMLEDREASVRGAAAKALPVLGAPASSLVPALERALGDPDVTVRRYALDALRQIDPGVKRVAGDVLGAKPAPAADLPVVIGVLGKTFDGAPSTSLCGAWPHFLGPDLDGISRERVCLRDGDPRVVWEVAAGHGYGGAVVSEGRVFFLDYDPGERTERLRCVSLDDGREIWRRGHTIMLEKSHGYTHTTPTAAPGGVVVIGAKGHLMCVEPACGRLLWGVDLDRTYKVKPDFRVQSPLIDGTTVVLATGGKDKFLVGLDLATGKTRWSTPNPGQLTMSYSSVLPMAWNGRKSYVYRAAGGTLGVSSTSGDLLWFDPQPLTTYAVIAPPLALEDGLLFLASGYGAGSRMSRVTAEGVEPVWDKTVKEGLTSEVHLPLALDDRIFGVAPRDAGALKEQFVCMDPRDGRVLWSSGPEKRFGTHAPFFLADGKFFSIDQQGALVILRARADRYEELSRTPLLTGAWHAAMALVEGRLLIREPERLVCVDVRD